jgi:hypothetical protein
VIGTLRRIFFPLCNGYTVILFVTFAGADGFGLAVASWLAEPGLDGVVCPR